MERNESESKTALLDEPPTHDESAPVDESTALGAVAAARAEIAAAEAAPAKRGRGRPKKTGGDQLSIPGTPPAASAPIEPAPSGPKKKLKTRDDYAAALDTAERSLADVRAKLAEVEARNNTGAIEALAEALKLGAHMATDYLAATRGKHWDLTEQEAQSLGNAWAVCLAPYASTVGQGVPWVMAIGVTWSIVGVRLAQDRRVRELDPAREVAAT